MSRRLGDAALWTIWGLGMLGLLVAVLSLWSGLAGLGFLAYGHIAANAAAKSIAEPMLIASLIALLAGGLAFVCLGIPGADFVRSQRSRR